MILSQKRLAYIVQCDGCHKRNRSLADGFGTEEQAIKDALFHGWTVGLDTAWCPRCPIPEPS